MDLMTDSAILINFVMIFSFGAFYLLFFIVFLTFQRLRDESDSDISSQKLSV